MSFRSIPQTKHGKNIPLLKYIRKHYKSVIKLFFTLHVSNRKISGSGKENTRISNNNHEMKVAPES
jgi:hypothetical protein